jgi:hypothetical protein
MAISTRSNRASLANPRASANDAAIHPVRRDIPVNGKRRGCYMHSKTRDSAAHYVAA